MDLHIFDKIIVYFYFTVSGYVYNIFVRNTEIL